MKYKTANAYYFRSILAIGGIESHLYYVAQKYGKYDITVFYRDGDPKQIKRLKKWVRCIQLTDTDWVECDKLFCCFNREILNQCTAKTKYLVLHGDYETMVKQKQLDIKNLPLDKRIDKYLGVSQLVCDSWERLTGIHAELIGEPVVLSEKRPLMLLSATRLSKEKGWERMKKLANALNMADIPFFWLIFTNAKKSDAVKGMEMLPPRLDIAGLMPHFDAVVQLSDNEGYCLTAVEALSQGVPIIGTDIPVFKEIGINETNAVLLPLDMSDIPLDKIKNIPNLKFSYQQAKDSWEDYFTKVESTYEPEPDEMKFFLVRATREWSRLRLIDAQQGFVPKEDHEWIIDEDRLYTLQQYENRKRTKLIKVLRTSNNDSLFEKVKN